MGKFSDEVLSDGERTKGENDVVKWSDFFTVGDDWMIPDRDPTLIPPLGKSKATEGIGDEKKDTIDSNSSAIPVLSPHVMLPPAILNNNNNNNSNNNNNNNNNEHVQSPVIQIQPLRNPPPPPPGQPPGQPPPGQPASGQPAAD